MRVITVWYAGHSVMISKQLRAPVAAKQAHVREFPNTTEARTRNRFWWCQIHSRRTTEWEITDSVGGKR